MCSGGLDQNVGFQIVWCEGFLKRSADLNITNQQLVMAILKYCYLETGADQTVVDQDGKTPLCVLTTLP